MRVHKPSFMLHVISIIIISISQMEYKSNKIYQDLFFSMSINIDTHQNFEVNQ